LKAANSVLLPFSSGVLESSIGPGGSAVSAASPAASHISAKAIAAIIDHKNYIAEKEAANQGSAPQAIDKTAVPTKELPPFCRFISIEPVDFKSAPSGRDSNQNRESFKIPPYSSVRVAVEFYYIDNSQRTVVDRENDHGLNMCISLEYVSADPFALAAAQREPLKPSVYFRRYVSISRAQFDLLKCHLFPRRMSFETRITPDSGLSLRRLFVACPGRMQSSDPSKVLNKPAGESQVKGSSSSVHSAPMAEEMGHLSMDVLDHLMQTLAAGASSSSPSGVRGAGIAPARVEVAGDDSFLVLEVRMLKKALEMPSVLTV
jgi:hypothetical protein